MSNSENVDRRRATIVLGLGLTFAILTAIIRPLSTFNHLAYNLVPIGGLALYFGARQSRRAALMIPLFVMVASDVILFVFSGWNPDYSLLHMSRPFVYGSILVYVTIGRWARSTTNPAIIGSCALLGSFQFYLITNFQSWLELSSPLMAEPLYSRDLAGLLDSYLAGLPFYGPTIASDLIFTAIFFGVHALAVRLFEGSNTGAALANDM